MVANNIMIHIIKLELLDLKKKKCKSLFEPNLMTSTGRHDLKCSRNCWILIIEQQGFLTSMAKQESYMFDSVNEVKA